MPSGADKGFSYGPYIAVALVVGLVAFVVFGFYRSFNNVSTQDEKRIERQTAEQAAALESLRTGDRERMQKVANITANVNSDIRKFNEQKQKALQPALDKMQKENERMRSLPPSH